MDANEARRVIESLRYGLPPDGHICDFTVGRQDEIADLRSQLNEDGSNALLLNANYGAGKTHLLRFIREEALRKNWLVSFVTLDSKAGVRFDKLSQIIGAICRNIENPHSKHKGIRYFLDALVDPNMHDPTFWSSLSFNGKWDRRMKFESETFFIGLRAWFFADADIKNYIENWFHTPKNNPGGMSSTVYNTLIEGMRRYFRDMRPKSFFCRNRIDLTYNDDLCWKFLSDLDTAAKALGLRGFVLCLDEFEDILYNLPRINAKEAAFYNLVEMFLGNQFKAHAYFAVTPGFVQKCKQELRLKGRYDYDYSQFDELKQFEMSPINKADMKILIKMVLQTYRMAYSWDPPDTSLNAVLTMLDKFSSNSSQNRVRQCIRNVVQELDRGLD
jgi:hypothetical protein